MGTFLVFIIKSTLCLTVFYLFYRLLLSHDTFHRMNRVMLLGIVLLSLALPFVKWPTETSSLIQQPLHNIEYLLLMASQSDNASAAARTPHAGKILNGGILIYFTGILFCLFQFLYSLLKIIRLIRSGEKRRVGNKIYLVSVTQPSVSFSWMKYIIISHNDLQDSGKAIWLHELAHIRAGHSWDMLLMGIFAIFHWFNPVVWLLKEDLQNVHEYEADEKVIKQGINMKQYQLLLIRKAVGTQRFTSMANSFNHSKLKSRITMMLKRKSNSYARLKYLYVLPLSALAIAAFARPEITRQLAKISSVKVMETSSVSQTNVAKNDVAENDPATQSRRVGSQNKTESLQSDTVVHIPIIMDIKNKPLIVINGVESSESNITDMDATEVESVNVLKGNSAIQKYGERAKNGVVEITLKKKDSSLPQNWEEKAACIVDGKEVSKSELDAIAPDLIESMNIIKDEKMIKAKYGDIYNGRAVIEITLKK